jgi:glycosyltransferase involved in cell wall biosynthesis
MLEMASPNHFRCIYDILYVYDNNTELNDHNVRFQLQWDLGKLVFHMPNYAPLDRSEADAQKRIVIVTASYKNAEWYLWNLSSVFEQNYENWHLIYIDDCSPDRTGELVEEYVRLRGFDKNVTVIRNGTRKKALANLYNAIHMCAPDDIVVLLDGDDRFSSRNVLKEVNQMYTEHDVWLTYGQFKRYPDGSIGFCCPMPEDIIANNAFREFPVPPSHLRTFYAGLFHKIKLEDLMYEGDFFPITYDLAIMYPMIEMARDHFMFCSKPLLEYNVANPINDHKVNYDLQIECDRVIRERSRYEKIESPF